MTCIVHRWRERRDSALRFSSGCQYILFKSNKWVSPLFQQNIFTCPIWKAYNTLWSAGCFRNQNLKCCMIWVSRHQANINLKHICMLGKIIVNLIIHRKEKQHYLHYTVCGADHSGRIICALTEQNLNRPQLISSPPILHSPGTLLHVSVPCCFHQHSLPAMFPQSVKK